jgi:hypothetical protein
MTNPPDPNGCLYLRLYCVLWRINNSWSLINGSQLRLTNTNERVVGIKMYYSVIRIREDITENRVSYFIIFIEMYK